MMNIHWDELSQAASAALERIKGLQTLNEELRSRVKTNPKS
jgi:hypothetical protein